MFEAVIEVGKKPTGIAITPDGAWVYVTNSQDKTVSVISTATNKVVATVPVGLNPRGVVVTPDPSLVRTVNPMPRTVPEEPSDEKASSDDEYSVETKPPNTDNAVIDCPCWTQEELSTVSDVNTEECYGDQARGVGRIHGGRDDKNYRIEGAYADNLQCVIRFNKGPWSGSQPLGGEVDRKKKLTEAEQHNCITTIIAECKNREFWSR
jgi:YVTN family beta-propeller protein